MTLPEKIHPENSPDKSVRVDGGGNAASSHSEIHDRTGLYISILALALAGIALGLWLNQSQIIDAKVAAAMAIAKEQMQQQVSDAKSDASSAQVNARVALDKVEDFRTKLADKGINIKLDGH